MRRVFIRMIFFERSVLVINVRASESLRFETSMKTMSEEPKTLNEKRSQMPDRRHHKIVLIFGFSFFFLSFPAVSAENPPTKSHAAIRAFNLAVEQFNAKHFKEAIPYLDEAVSQDDHFAEAYYARGACKNYLKGYDGAVMDLSDAVRLKPELVDARALRGEVFFELDQWDQAMEDFNYVLQHNPGDTLTLLNRGVVFMKREDSAGALRDFRNFLKLKPSDPRAPQVRKIVASLLGEALPPEKMVHAGVRSAENASPHSLVRKPSAAAQRMSDSLLLGRPLSENFANRMIHGERTETEGDIHRVVPRAHSTEDSTSDIQIVTPQ